MRGIVVENVGRDHKLILGEVPTPRPGFGEVLIQVAAAGVNRADLLQARGAYPPPPGASELLGLECSGVIAELGADVDGWSVGDEVAALLPGGGYAQYAVADAACLFPVTGSLALADAGAAPESICTVWSNLTEAGYEAGAPLLVHGGAGGIGSMAITLGAALGSLVFATAGGDERARACEQLGAARGIDHTSEDFPQVVLEGTGFRGVDYIIDIVGGPYLERNLKALAVGGTLAIIGLMGGSAAQIDLGRMLSHRHRVMATNLRGRTRPDKAAICRAVRRDVWELVTSGRSAPAVGARLPMSQAQDAHALMKSGSVVGKILLVWD
ncbi:MAG: NAD(P)H-quinone oxidoreductase [Bifidobacteriaceae bacterium]|jgi:putative PIG3 family NAD(P)H quinone oxidoreductase|nr:NAD(P)H-quinone oxidoreductase [Bifidobacteriaceae bacterium]